MNNISVTDFTVNGKCSSCGRCCSDLLPLSKNEVQTIKAYIQKHKIKEQRHNVAFGADLTCPFRDEANRKCLIYPIRPAICRSFMCNHTHEDIAKTKFDFHAKHDVVFMRKEFFGSDEDIDWFMKMVMG